jgi:hypothetical protein
MQTARMTSPLSERRCSALFRQQDDLVGPEPDEVFKYFVDRQGSRNKATPLTVSLTLE